MTFNPDQPFNDLPPLPPAAELESKSILKKAISASRALAELKGMAERMGTYYRGFVNEEARALGFTLDDLRAWKPAPTASRRGRRRSVG